jgi:hypothetical protein
VNVNGLNLVPFPPLKTSAFMVILSSLGKT